jgi:hypothetical protein
MADVNEDETPADLAEHMSVSSRLDRLSDMVSGLGQPRRGETEERLDRPSNRRRDPGNSLVNEATDRGHLYKGAQTKCKYLAPTSFALISGEVSEMPVSCQTTLAHTHVDICDQ